MLPPGSAAAGVAYRMLMAGSLPRLAGSRDAASRALATALRTTSLGRPRPEERAWIRRIEQRRRELISGEALTGLALDSAGGAREGEVRRRAQEIGTGARWTSIAPVWGLFLMRLVRELAPRSCLELGTGFGLSAAYQAAALDLNGAGRLTSLDFVPELAAVAGQGLSALGLDERVELRAGPISDTLEDVLEAIAPVDYALVDADHTENATLEHFDRMLGYLSAGAIVVFDDINWTDGMKRAWRAIRRHQRVSVALGVRRIGVTVIVPGASRSRSSRSP